MEARGVGTARLGERGGQRGVECLGGEERWLPLPTICALLYTFSCQV